MQNLNLNKEVLMANEIKGIVKAVRKDKKGLMIEDKWYSNSFLQKKLECQKGDEVVVTLTDKGYLQEVEIIKKSENQSQAGSATTAEERKEMRINVDAGNILQRATELTICVVNNSKDEKAVNEVLNEAVNQLLKQFRRIKYDLSIEKEEEAKEKDEEDY